MSIQFVLDPTYSYIKNTKLNQNLEVSSSLKAPVHYVEDLSISKNESGNMVFDAPVVEAVILKSDAVNTDSVFTSALNPLVDTDTVSVNGNLDLLGTSSLENVVGLSLASGAGAENQVLSLDSSLNLVWKNDVAGDVSQWSTYNAVSDVNLGSNNLNASKTITDDVWTNYISLPKDGSGSSIELNSYTNTGKIPTLKVNSLDTILPESTQINVNKNLNLSSNTLYCGTLNAGTNIISSTFQMGVESNKFAPYGDAYVMVQNDGDNRVQSISHADLVGFSDIQSYRGKFYTTDISLNEKFSADSTGAIVSESISTKNIIIPDSTPSSGQVIKYNGVGVEWANDTNTPSTWSEYPATQVVDMSENDINNAGTINSNYINIAPFDPEIYSLKTTNSQVLIGKQTELNSNDLYLATNSDYSNKIKKGEITTQELKLMKGLLDEPARLQVWNSISQNVVDVNAFSNEMVSQTSANMSGFGTISCAQLKPTFKPTNTLWVASNGNNSSGNGSYESPYLTIQQAINYAESLYNNTYWYINVLPGTYAGFTVSKKCFIKGSGPSSVDGQSVGCQINSDITISFDSNDADMFNNALSLSGFLITGEILCNSGNTARQCLNINDCYLYNDSGSGSMIHYNPAASDGRVRLYNTRIVNQSVSGNQPTINISVGMLKMNLCEVAGSSDVNILKLDGTARIDSIVQCSFTSNTASTTAAAIVQLSGTGNVYTFAQNAFIYTSSANKSASVNSCAILCNSATTQPTVILTYSSFFLGGTSSSTNFILQDSNFGNARTAIILYFSNNANLNNAYQLKGVAGTNKFSLQAVA